MRSSDAPLLPGAVLTTTLKLRLNRGPGRPGKRRYILRDPAHPSHRPPTLWIPFRSEAAVIEHRARSGSVVSRVIQSCLGDRTGPPRPA
jgi:hypothetical protein